MCLKTQRQHDCFSANTSEELIAFKYLPFSIKYPCVKFFFSYELFYDVVFGIDDSRLKCSLCVILLFFFLFRKYFVELATYMIKYCCIRPKFYIRT